ncbi:pyridoxamine 5'-phosphate oxidase family protein [Sphingomonas sp. ST-64]|uniref:Pyridoxamine 5'-phosphate oxidase family protein n=1 Tax=Sphingomonas plantiphila TaxID=3163295 RepID=A0ABW8YTR1_9SPHN
MPTPQELAAKFWKALDDDRTLFLGLDGARDGHAQPMTALRDTDRAGGPIWFFTTKDNGLVAALAQGHRAMAHFASKGHEVWATIHGNLSIDHDRETIDRLWNPFVAAWYEGGKDDPNLELLRLDTEHGQIWLNENSLFAGIKMLLGADPKADYSDKVADVSLA